MKKVVFSIFAVMLALPSFAKKDVYEGFDIYNLGTNKPKKSVLALDFGVGTGVYAGLRYQVNFGKYFAWDVLSARYTYDYMGDENWERSGGYYADGAPHELAITTGFRLFTPTFASGKLKAFLSAGVGYGASHFDNYYERNSNYKGDEWQHTAVVPLTAGLYIKDKFYFGYGYTFYGSGYWKNCFSHFASFGLNF